MSIADDIRNMDTPTLLERIEYYLTSAVQEHQLLDRYSYTDMDRDALIKVLELVHQLDTAIYDVLPDGTD